VALWSKVILTTLKKLLQQRLLSVFQQKKLDEALNYFKKLSVKVVSDTLVSQNKHLEKSAELTKITIYLSTDEFSLPYTPTESWRLEVVFKQVVRSLILTFRKIATFLILVFVYLPIIIPLIFFYYFLKNKKK